MGERLICIQEVAGSIPVSSTHILLLFENLEIGKIESPVRWFNVAKSSSRKKHFGKATKGVRGMPRHMETMKDAISCDKLRVGANNLRSGDFPMG